MSGKGERRDRAQEEEDEEATGNIGRADIDENNVVVQYVALEDFLIDQDTGMVVETTRQDDENAVELKRPGDLVVAACGPVGGFQIVRPQRQKLERLRESLSPEGEEEPQDLVKRPSELARTTREAANAQPHQFFAQRPVPAGITEDLSRTSSLEALADAASVVGGLSDDGAVTEGSAILGRRRNRHPIPDGLKDQRYWERRIKNNVAAKRSRESKREKENQLTDKVAYLEKEHAVLMSEIQSARSLNLQLRDRLSKYERVDSDASTSGSL